MLTNGVHSFGIKCSVLTDAAMDYTADLSNAPIGCCGTPEHPDHHRDEALEGDAAQDLHTFVTLGGSSGGKGKEG